MLAAGAPGLQRQFDGDQHRFEAMPGDGAEHVGHDPVPAGLFEQDALQSQQWLRHFGKRGAVPERAGLSLDDADIVGEVVAGLVALEAAHVARDFLALGHQAKFRPVDAQAQHGMGMFRRHAVAVPLEVDQRRAGDPDGFLDLAVERLRVRLHLHQLVLQQFGKGQRRPFRVGGMPMSAGIVGRPRR